MISEALLIIAILLIFTYVRLTKNNDYWKKRGVKHVKPSLLFGNFAEVVLFRKSFADHHLDLYKAAEGEPYFGAILAEMEPALYLRDPEVIRHVLCKDFSHFHDRGFPCNEKHQPLSANLFGLEGARWRTLRTKLTPAFSSGKMKNMMPLMQEVTDEMLGLLDGYAQQSEPAEMREVGLCFTTDIIGSCAFGVKCNALSNPDAEFRKMGVMMFKPSKILATIHLVFQIFPTLADLIPMPGRLKMNDFFVTAFKNAASYRAGQTGSARNDFLDLLIQVREKGNIAANLEELKNDPFYRDIDDTEIENFEFTDTLMAAQAFIFFFAGFETSPSTMSYALMELSLNPGLQEKLQAELDEHYAANGNKFTYEDVAKMPLLDKVVSETLRKYPPLPFIMRRVTQRYKMPDSNLILEKGLKVMIPIHAIQNDPKHYPNPEIFDPERFSEDAKKTRHHYLYLPFGEGPRHCIAQRFALQQVKLGLASLLQRYTFALSPQLKFPLKYPIASPLISPIGGAPLLLKKRNN